MTAKRTTASYDNTGLRYVNSVYGELEVVEATADLFIQPQKADIKRAVMNDPEKCIFSRACRRMYGSKAVIFFGTVAYVDLLGDDGTRRVHRFVLSKSAQAYIRDFDDGKPLSPKGFQLRTPAKSETLDETKKRAVALKKKTRKALLKGETVISKSTTGPTKKPRTMRLSAFRNGSGMVHFPQRRTA